MNQRKISTKPIDKSLQDAARWKLYMFVLKLINPSEYRWYMEDRSNYN